MRWSWTLFSDGGKEAVLAAEAEDVPGIDHRPALDRPVQQVLDRRQLRGRLGQLAALDRQVGGGQPAAHVALHPGRGHRHDRGLPRRRLRIAHGREELRQVDVLQLLGAAAGQVMVEVLPRAAERLPQRQRLGPQPLGVRARQLRSSCS